MGPYIKNSEWGNFRRPDKLDWFFHYLVGFEILIVGGVILATILAVIWNVISMIAS